MSEVERAIKVYGLADCSDCKAVKLLLRKLNLPYNFISTVKNVPEDAAARKYGLRIGKQLGRMAWPVVVIADTEGRTRSHIITIEPRGLMLHESLPRVLAPNSNRQVLTPSTDYGEISPEITIYGKGAANNNPAVGFLRDELGLSLTYFDTRYQPEARRTMERIGTSVDKRAGYVVVLSDIYSGREATDTSPEIPPRNCRMAFINPTTAASEELLYSAMQPYANR